MNRYIIMILMLLIGFYGGLAYYGYSNESTDDKLGIISGQIHDINQRLDQWEAE